MPARDSVIRPGPVLSDQELAAYAGTYSSDEAETTFTVAVQGRTLVLKRRPADVIELKTQARDTFRASIGTVTFSRDASGSIAALSIKQERVWDLRFTRVR
jgi:hypothetical protein